MIEFIEIAAVTALKPSGQFSLFPEYIIEPGDVGVVVESDETSITFLLGDAILWIQKNLEGVTYVCH